MATTTLEFADFLRLIDERSVAFRAAIASAPSLDVQVPSCPEWTLLDLVLHLGKSQRRWATIVATGPADGPPDDSDAPAAPQEREALLAWSAEGTTQLLSALREAGQDRGCWTWWGVSQTPQTSGAVARHQVQHITVHTYDAQLTLGAPQPLPDEAALDGVGEFLSTCCGASGPWPHEAAAVDYHATEGSSWRLSLTADGARTTPLTQPDAVADASLRGTASDLVLVLYARIPVDSVTLGGDHRLFDLLLDW